MADLGVHMTNDALRRLDRRLQRNYRTALNTALERQKTAIDKLVAFDESKFAGFTAEQLQAQRIVHMNRVMRETNVANNIAAELANGGKAASQMIQREMQRVHALNLDWGQYSIDSQAGIYLDWPMLDRRQMRELMKESESPFTKIAYRNMGQERPIVRRLQNEFTQAMLLGEGRKGLEKRISKVTGQSLAQARRVAQTEVVRVQSAARYESLREAQDMGLEMEKEWNAKMMATTRDTHAELDGVVLGGNERFSNGLLYPGDPDGEPGEVINCHCYIINRLKNVPDSVKKYREEQAMKKETRFEEWQERKYGKDVAKSGESDIMKAGGEGGMQNAFIEAKSGKRNHGLYQALNGQTDLQLQKSVSSFTKNIEEHKDKIASPPKFIDNWSQRSEQYKTGIINKWEKDILRNEEQLAVALGVAKERGLNYE